jgi:hypothetical protein
VQGGRGGGSVLSAVEVAVAEIFHLLPLKTTVSRLLPLNLAAFYLETLNMLLFFKHNFFKLNLILIKISNSTNHFAPAQLMPAPLCMPRLDKQLVCHPLCAFLFRGPLSSSRPSPMCASPHACCHLLQLH